MRRAIIAAIAWMSIGIPPLAVQATGTVSITSDVSTVAVGGSITFTVTVTPNDHVATVILTYEGETGQDEDTADPWVFTHQFGTPTDNLTVIATVYYDNGDPPESASLDVNVVDLKITGSVSMLRGLTAAYLAESLPAGKAIDRFDWAYEWPGGANSYQDNDVDGDNRSVWLGRMVVSGTLTCRAIVSGISLQKSLPVEVRARSWSTAITCAKNNESGWGDEPVIGEELGQNRDRDSNNVAFIFVPQLAGGDFSTARTLNQVTSGPCSGLWFVYSSGLKCQRETVINKYIMSGGPVPLGTTANFYDVNGSGCFAPYYTADSFILAVAHHEYRGTPEIFKSLGGHQGRVEQAIIDFGYDPKILIEPLLSRNANDLAMEIDDIVAYAQNEVYTYESDESYMEMYGPNWGWGIDALGAGGHSRWDPTFGGWTDCVNGPFDF
jgi:hypothetical protein